MKTMLNLAVLAGLLGFSSVSHASMSYECARYIAGEWQGFIKISADNRVEAEVLAAQKYKDMGFKFDYVKCK